MMQYSLYIDCSFGMSVGLLDQQFKWVKFVQSKLPSKDLHLIINQLLEEKNISLQEVQKFFFCKGPGSYTGLRFVAGFEEFISWNKHECYDFYAFDLLLLSNLKNYCWLSPSFKKQSFICKVSNGKLEYKNVLVDEVDGYIPECKNILTSRAVGENIGEKFKKKFYEDIIQSDSAEVFSKISNLKESKDIFYYRTIEEEFRR